MAAIKRVSAQAHPHPREHAYPYRSHGRQRGIRQSGRHDLRARRIAPADDPSRAPRRRQPGSRARPGRLPGRDLWHGRASQDPHERRDRRVHSRARGAYGRRHDHQVHQRERDHDRRFLPQLRLPLYRHPERRLAAGPDRCARPDDETRKARHQADPRPRHDHQPHRYRALSRHDRRGAGKSPGDGRARRNGAAGARRELTAPYDAKVPGGLLPAAGGGTSADRFVRAVYQELKRGG